MSDTRRSAFAYLDIDDPQVAWLVYRGQMVSAPAAHPQALSSWTAGYLSAFAKRASRAARFRAELEIEDVRRRNHSSAVSRLSGFYVFEEKAAARTAMSAWRGHRYRDDFVAEVGIHDDAAVSRHDAAWITAKLDSPKTDWIDSYLSGAAYGTEPTWELVVDGRADIYGTELRERAHEVVKARWPKSLALLELARIAAWFESDLGLTTAMAVKEADGIRVAYVMNVADADDPRFLRRARESGHPINEEVLRDDLVLPDLRDRSFLIQES